MPQIVKPVCDFACLCHIFQLTPEAREMQHINTSFSKLIEHKSAHLSMAVNMVCVYRLLVHLLQEWQIYINAIQRHTLFHLVHLKSILLFH